MVRAPRGCPRDQDLKLNLGSQTSDPVCFSTTLSTRVPPSLCYWIRAESVAYKLECHSSDHFCVFPELRAKGFCENGGGPAFKICIDQRERARLRSVDDQDQRFDLQTCPSHFLFTAPPPPSCCDCWAQRPGGASSLHY